jgi:hypothetical protein
MATTNRSKPAAVIRYELMMPQAIKVMPNASTAGQYVGRGM